MQAISDNLIHFLGRQHKDSPSKQLDIFKSIIRNGLKCGKIDIKFGESGSVHNQVVCFTDIPLGLCEEQVVNYGKFGIGFKKSYIKKCGGNPVRYFINYLPGETRDINDRVESRGQLYACLCWQYRVLKQIDELIKNNKDFALYDQEGKVVYSSEGLAEWVRILLTIYSFEKETGELGPARDDSKEVDPYYKEREWRLVPLRSGVISGSVIFDEVGQAFYKFKRSDVHLVITPDQDTRKEVLKYFSSLEVEADGRLLEFYENPLPVIVYDDLKKW